MDGEDEEVIFQNRALHQALYEMGVENIDTEPVVAKQFQELSSDNDTSDGKTDGATGADNIHKIPTDFLTRLFLSQQDITSIYHSCQRQTLDRLKVSPLLSSDDRCFLDSFTTDESNNDQKVPDCRSQPLIRSFINFSRPIGITLGMCYIFIMSLCAVLDSHYTSDVLHLMDMYPVSFFSLSLAFGVVVIYSLLKSLLQHKLSIKLKEMDSTIREFEEGADKLSRIEKKCVRRIRESELAARGFTLTSLSSTVNSDSPILTQIDKWCPKFRVALFNGNRDVVGDLEKSYKLLTDSIPLVVDFKWLEFKPSQLSSSSSSGLNKGSDSSTSDGDDEEVIPTARLVSSQEFLQIHISAYVRRLVLSFVPKNCKDCQVNPYEAVSKSIQSCLHSIREATSLLEKHHSFYRAVYMNTDKTETLASQPDCKKDKSPLESFFVFVNSLDLHLQTVFRMTRDLTIHLEGLVDGQRTSKVGDETALDVVGMTDQNREEWMNTLKAIKTGLDSCKSCYEEAVKFLSHKDNKASPQLLHPSDSTQAPTQLEHVHRPVTVIPDADPVIEDQVFEAVIGPDAEEAKTTRRKIYTPEEKEQIRQKREDLSRFKQELKAVVDHRAIAQRKREERALARTQGKESSTTTTTTPSETDGSSAGGGEGDDEGDGSSVSAEMGEEEPKATQTSTEFVKQSTPSPPLEDVGLDETPVLMTNGKLENGGSPVSHDNKNDFGGEKMSLLAAKLDSADSQNCVNPSELPWAPLLRDECVKTSSSVATEGPSGKGKSSHSTSLSRQLPYDENWRSSLEKTKARHWEMCERIIQENKGAGDTSDIIKSSDPIPDTAGIPNGASMNDLDASSFVDISSDDLLFYPLDNDINSNLNNNNDHRDAGQLYQNGACASGIQRDSDKASSSCSSNSQIVCPKSINPEEEGFRDVHGAYVSRHNFTASGRGNVLEKALKEIRKQQEENDEEDDEDDKVVHPNRKRHRAGRQQRDLNNSKWVNISHVEFISCNGNQYELYRQKDMTAADIASHAPIPSPDPSSSLNTSLALMAAARSRQFNLGVEEQFIGDGEGDDDDDDDSNATRVEDEYSQAICAARRAGADESNPDVSQALPNQL